MNIIMKRMKQYSYNQFNVQEWILDSVTEFLKSPIWKNPIIQYIDENCIVFDNEEENKLEYTNIHNVIICN